MFGAGIDRGQAEVGVIDLHAEGTAGSVERT
jgi:hypothetical protein